MSPRIDPYQQVEQAVHLLRRAKGDAELQDKLAQRLSDDPKNTLEDLYQLAYVIMHDWYATRQIRGSFHLPDAAHGPTHAPLYRLSLTLLGEPFVPPEPVTVPSQKELDEC